MPRKGLGVEPLRESIRITFTVDGERRRLTLAMKPTPPNLKYAARLAADIRRDVAAGIFDESRYGSTGPRSTTVSSAAETFMRSKGALAPATRAQYDSAIRFWLRHLGADRAARSVKHSEIASIVGSFKWGSARHANNYLIPLRGMFDMMVRDGEILKSPVDGVNNLRRERPAPDPLTEQEADAVLDWMAIHHDLRVAQYFAFAFATGMRPEEIIALRWGDIDWDRNIIRVHRAKTFKGGIKGTKTGVERDVEMSRRAYLALFEMKRHTLARGAEVFENPVTGRPWHDERAQRETYWNPALAALGISPRRAYCTRHTFATTALARGCNPAWVAAQLGNSLEIMCRVYARWIRGSDNGAEVGKLNNPRNSHDPS